MAKYRMVPTDFRKNPMVMDCIFSELKEVEDPSLIQYVSELILNEGIIYRTGRKIDFR